MNSQKNLHKPCIIIFGPTAVGKTALAEQLGTQLPIEIINMDMGQLYSPLTIGTAKPAWRQSPIPHHMFDVVDTPRNYTVVEYQEQVVPLIQEIQERGNVPVLVGGSAFYLHSLLFSSSTHQSSGNVRSPIVGTWDELNAIDSERASKIHPHDEYRINRALTIWQTTGTKPSLYVPQFNPPLDCMLIFLTRERGQLYDRINTRVEQMIHEGWEAECETLCGTPWESFACSKGIIGYREMMAVGSGKDTVEQAIPVIAQQTRRYAKRQTTFWRMLSKKIMRQQADTRVIPEEVNLTLLDLDLYISQLLQRIQSFYR